MCGLGTLVLRCRTARAPRGWRFGTDACGARAAYACCSVATVGYLFELHVLSHQWMFCTSSFLFSKITTTECDGYVRIVVGSAQPVAAGHELEGV